MTFVAADYPYVLSIIKPWREKAISAIKACVRKSAAEGIEEATYQ